MALGDVTAPAGVLEGVPVGEGISEAREKWGRLEGPLGLVGTSEPYEPVGEAGWADA